MSNVLQTPHGKRSTAWWAGFALILLLAATLRIGRLGQDEVRTDEGNYALRAVGWNDFMFSTTLGTPWVWLQEAATLPAWTQLSFNDHPPLHFAAIWLSTRLFGVTLWAARLPSVLYGVGSIALVMLLLRRWGKYAGALAAGAMLALLPWHIFINRQAIQESGVMFFLVATVYLCEVIAAKSAADRQHEWRWWATLGAVLGLGLLTKYSAALALLPVAYLTVARRWYRRAGFWLMPFALVMLLSPILVYNRQLLLLRGHFDLQLSRLLRQDTQLDWPASHQAIWQGDPRAFPAFLQHQALGLSLPALALLLAGAGAAIARRRAAGGTANALWFGLAGGALLTLVTLNDYGRSSILLPWYALALGVTVESIAWGAQRAGIAVTLVLLALAQVPAVAATGTMSALVKTFPPAPLGFDRWEAWRANHLPTAVQPQHFRSLLDWLNYLLERSGARPDDVVVFDDRITWFASNWYFFRYGFYATDAAFINAGIFSFLVPQGALDHLKGRYLWYVEAGPAGRDPKTGQSLLTDQFFTALKRRQRAAPTVITGRDGEPLLLIWRLRWEGDVRFPTARADVLPRRARIARVSAFHRP